MATSEMSVQVKTSDDREWVAIDDVLVTGSGFLNGEQLSGVALAEQFENLNSPEAIGERADRLHGHFAAVVFRGDEVYGIVDHIGSIPLFYGVRDGNGYLSDDGEWIREQLDAETIGRHAAIEYLLYRFVTGADTLYQGVKQSRPGELIAINGTGKETTIGSTAYYTHKLTTPVEGDRNKLKEEFDRHLENAFDRFIEHVGDRTIAVSLSGGYDSRLITSLLRRRGRDDVITFSCKQGSQTDIDRARSVAESVDLPWEYADLSPKDWREFYESDDWDQYQRTGLALSGKPFVFDLAPIMALKRTGRIPDDAVFVSGHTAIDPARPMNRYLREERPFDVEELVDAIIEFHHCQWDFEGVEIRRYLEERIREEVGSQSFDSRLDAVDAFERWRWRERESKYIITHHLRVYDYVGHDWWLPLYDRELLDFWCRTPIDAKAGRELYQRYVDQLYADVADIPLREARVTTGSSQITSWIESLVSGTQFKSVTSDIYHELENLKDRFGGQGERDLNAMRSADPRLGMVPDRIFDHLDDDVGSFNGLQSAAVLGLLSFDDSEAIDVPGDGTFRWEEKPLASFPEITDLSEESRSR